MAMEFRTEAGSDFWLLDGNQPGSGVWAGSCDCCGALDVCDDFEGDLSQWSGSSNAAIVVDPAGPGNNVINLNVTGSGGGGSLYMDHGADVTAWRIDGELWATNNGSTGNGGVGIWAYNSGTLLCAVVLNGVGEVWVYNDAGSGAVWTDTGVTRSLDTWHGFSLIQLSSTQTSINLGGFIANITNANGGQLDTTYIGTQNGGEGYADDVCTTGTYV